MRSMEEAKKKYNEIPIPEELSERVMCEVRKSEAKRAAEKTKKRAVRFPGRKLGKGAAAAAAAIVVFTAALNTSPVFADNASEIPVIGAVARVLTFRFYEAKTDEIKIAVDIPSIEVISEETGNVAEAVNKEIYHLCTQYADEAVARAEEYRQAFLDTGGTEKEWADHHIAIKVGFKVKSQTDRYLSVAVTGTENWTSAYSETRYYNFDLKTGTAVTLKDLLGDDYIRIADAGIRRQIKEREEAGADYWEQDFTGITKDTEFYINKAGNPVIVFGKYEIAPGAAGEPEFEIVK